MNSSSLFKIAPAALLGCVLAAATAHANTDHATATPVITPEFAQALAAYDAGRLEDALQLFEQLSQRFPDHPQLLNNRAVIAAQQGDPERAIQLLKRMIATDATMNTGYRNLSAIYAHLASLAYRDALSLQPPEPSTPQLSLVGVEAVATLASRENDAMTEAADQAAQAQEADTPLVRDPQVPLLSEREREVATAVRRWARAWAEQDLKAYFASYINDYTPPGGEHRRWRRQRSERVTAPRQIEIRLSELRIRMNGDRAAQVRFVQAYQSNRLSSTVIKQLKMQKFNDEWKITLERVL